MMDLVCLDCKVRSSAGLGLWSPLTDVEGKGSEAVLQVSQAAVVFAGYGGPTEGIFRCPCREQENRSGWASPLHGKGEGAFDTALRRSLALLDVTSVVLAL